MKNKIENKKNNNQNGYKLSKDKNTKGNNWDNSFVFTFNKKHFLTQGRFALNNIFKTNNELQNFLFYLHEKFYMESILSVNQLKQRNKILRKSFEKLTKTQIKCMEKNPSTRNIVDNCADCSIYQIPLDKKPRLFGFFIDNCFHIVAYDPDHEVFPSRK